MDMDTDMGTGASDGPVCKISMLWNWYTVDACFLSKQWRVTSEGMMVGSCIGVVLLVVVLEALRRGSREYDKYLARTLAARARVPDAGGEAAEGMIKGSETGSGNSSRGTEGAVGKKKRYGRIFSKRIFKSGGLRPSFWQQGMRATLHMCQFAVAYFVSFNPRRRWRYCCFAVADLDTMPDHAVGDVLQWVHHH